MSRPQADRVELLQGTLDLIVLGVTRAGQRGLERETGRWMRLAGLVNKLLTNES
jgi:hypothetical protein